MANKEIDQKFRDFTKARGDRREVWFHYYFPLFFRAVHLNGVLVIVGGILFGLGWYFLMKNLGFPQNSPFMFYPFAADFGVVFVLMALHSKRG